MSSITADEWKKRISGSAMRTKTPIFAHYELTPRCNLDCKMCYVHNEKSNSMGDRELSTETWKRIFDEAYDMGLMFATLTGGECLLRSDFRELYLHLWNKRVSITVLTNGILLNEEYVEFFKNHKPERIQISLYGSSEECYHNVTGHGGFAKVIRAIKMLLDAGISVRVSVTPSRYMGKDYVNIIRLCRENGFPIGSSEMSLISNRDNPEKDDYYLTVEEIVSMSQERTLLYRELTPVSCLPEPCGPMTEDAPKSLTCSAGNCTASVTWDGKMYPCASVIENGSSLLEMSYAEAWEKTKRYASEMLLGKECVGCPYDNVCPKCPAIRLTDLHSGHCNPSICELTRKLVAAGVNKLDQKPQSCEE